MGQFSVGINSTWAHTALYPDAKGVGMLGNPMYAGKPIWNRTNGCITPSRVSVSDPFVQSPNV